MDTCGTPRCLIDVYLGQPTAPDQFEFALPAIFIDYSADYNAEIFYLYLHIIQDFAEDTENFAPNRSEGLKFNDYLTVVKSLLNGLRVRPVFGALHLYQETPTQTEYFYDHTITFRCTLNTDLYARNSNLIDAQPILAKVEKGHLKDTNKGV